MSPRTASRLAWGLWAGAMVLTALAVAFLAAGWSLSAPAGTFGSRGTPILVAVTFAMVGALVASRQPSSWIGWLMLAAGIGAGIQELTQQYAIYALAGDPGTPPGAETGAWITSWIWVVSIGLVATSFLRFPDGELPSDRWRPVPWFVAGATVLLAVSIALAEGPLESFKAIDNPYGITGSRDVMSIVLDLAYGLFSIAVLLSAAAVVVRFRRSRGEERLQLKWIAFTGAIATAILVVSFAAQITAGVSREIPTALENLVLLGFLTIPVGLGIAVLKYRLYDIDLVIGKTVVYGALALFITVVYVAVVVGVGAIVGSQGSALLSAVAAAIVALAFQPVRRWAQRVANRLVYGKRATPYEVLSELSSRFAGTYSLEDALPRLARVAAQAVGAERSHVWLITGSELRSAASWPSGTTHRPVPLHAGALPEIPGERAFPVLHQGELLGALSVVIPANDPLTAVQDKLLGDVSAQAGLVLRNVALLEDLRASRRRIVAAQDERAKALERNIHDGAQQQLVALSVKLRLAQQLVERDQAKANEMLVELQADATDALENLRDLARGIYPPLLADKGLAEALGAQARRSPVPVTVEAEGVGRLGQDVEAAIYFCVLEALQNVAKYAEASHATVRLSNGAGELAFEVVDDGRGFDPVSSGYGTGLQGMADRLSALGGELEVRSAPGTGTTIAGVLPFEGLER